MVKPTGTQDALKLTNRFEVLGRTSQGTRNPRTLEAGNQNKTNLDDPTRIIENGEKGECDLIWEKECESLQIPDKHSGNQGKKQFFRNRSNSTKRKQSADSGSVPSKTPRLEINECAHLKTVQDNASRMANIVKNLTDYTGNETVIAESIRELALGVSSLNDIIGILLAERLVPGESPNPLVDETPVPTGNSTRSTGTVPKNNNTMSMNNTNQGNNRQPLRQEPLGGPPTWATVASSRAKVKKKKNPKLQKDDSGKPQFSQDQGGGRNICITS